MAAAAAAVCGWTLWLHRATPVPTEDAASYLWMAERFAAGHAAAALESVFPPGWPLAIAPWVALGCAAERAGGLLAALALGAAVPAVWRIGNRLHPGAGAAAGWLFAASPLLPRMGAELFSEPLFLLLMAWGTCWGLVGRSVLCGWLAGLAYWVRPEGVLLAVAFAAARPRRHALALVPAAAMVLLLPAWRWSQGLPWQLLPLHTFHATRDDLPERAAWLANLVAVPWPFVEALGPAALLLLGHALRPVRRGLQDRAALPPLWLGVLLQIAAVCSFVVRRRFFVSATVPVVVLAGAVLAGWPRRVRALGLGVAVACGGWVGVAGLLPESRRVERELGAHLAATLPAAGAMVSDLPRVVYWAGRRPPEPRHFTAAQLVAQALVPEVQVVVLATGSQRASAAAAARELAVAFRPRPLPEPLASRCADLGIAVLERR
jgi:hypothetical protein